MPVNSHLPSLPPPPETAQWWLIGPSPMEFENVGFTRPVQPIADSGRSFALVTSDDHLLIACNEQVDR